MPAMKFRKKPVEIEAFQLTRDNSDEVVEWVRDNGGSMASGIANGGSIEHAEVSTLEGVMRVDWGDWIIRGVQGECYPCKPDIFEATYELAERSGS